MQSAPPGQHLRKSKSSLLRTMLSRPRPRSDFVWVWGVRHNETRMESGSHQKQVEFHQRAYSSRFRLLSDDLIAELVMDSGEQFSEVWTNLAISFKNLIDWFLHFPARLGNRRSALGRMCLPQKSAFSFFCHLMSSTHVCRWAVWCNTLESWPRRWNTNLSSTDTKNTRNFLPPWAFPCRRALRWEFNTSPNSLQPIAFIWSYHER